MRGEWVIGLGLGFNNDVGTEGVLGVCMYLCSGEGGRGV